MKLFDQVGEDSVEYVGRLAPSSSSASWTLQNLSELWLAAHDEVQEWGLLLHSVRGNPAVFDDRDRHVDPPTRAGRRLLIHVDQVNT
ncbi:MAG: hypothetical protein JSS14_27380 [Proteobacteria bacterium]|nr:hypothetical protein [Pseudomonadota bacterium]